MKKFYFILAIIAVIMMFVGCPDGTNGANGANGKDGTNGKDGIGIVWKGSWDCPPEDPELNWAYYNVEDKKSYIYDGSSWQILAKDGQDVTTDVRVPSYTIIFSANGGKGKMSKMVCEIGKTYDVPECEFNAPNSKMKFVGWDLIKYQKTFCNLSETDGDIVILMAMWNNTEQYGLAGNGNIVLDYVEYPNTAFVEVTDYAVTVNGTKNNWNGYCDSTAPDYYKGVFIAGRTVKLSPYKIGKYEVTQQLYEAVMNTGRTDTVEVYGYKYSGGYGDNYPVYRVSWCDAIVFCNKLSILMGKTPCYSCIIDGMEIDWEGLLYSDIHNLRNEIDWRMTVDMTADGYRLPTEAEWEFAARGGDQSEPAWKYAFAGINSLKQIYRSSTEEDGDYFGDNLDLGRDNNLASLGWYCNNSSSSTHPVGSKTANRLGIYDMSGNVAEWCWDKWSEDVTSNDSMYKKDGVVIDPLGPTNDSFRCLRGGDFNDYAYRCSVSCRSNSSGSFNAFCGFRLVQSVR